MSLILQSVQVSILSMSVIFVVLGVLIVVIEVMVHYLPYTAPPPPPPRAQAPAATASGSSQDDDHIAAIHAALAHHLGKAPHEIQISNIQTL